MSIMPVAMLEIFQSPYNLGAFVAVVRQWQDGVIIRLGQRIALPATVIGSMNRAGDVDFYRFEAKDGQEIGVQVTTAAIGSKLDPVLQLLDSSDHVLEESTNGILGHSCQKAGVYALSVRDREYRGGSQMNYRLHVGDIPVVTAVYPLGLQRGTEQWLRLQGVNLGSHETLTMAEGAFENLRAAL